MEENRAVSLVWVLEDEYVIGVANVALHKEICYILFVIAAQKNPLLQESLFERFLDRDPERFPLTKQIKIGQTRHWLESNHVHAQKTYIELHQDVTHFERVQAFLEYRRLKRSIQSEPTFEYHKMKRLVQYLIVTP